MNLKELKENLSKEIFGQTKQEACNEGICISCKQPAIPKCYSQAGLREYQISGMCEECFDKLFEEG
jgi:hypothetical protein